MHLLVARKRVGKTIGLWTLDFFQDIAGVQLMLLIVCLWQFAFRDVFLMRLIYQNMEDIFLQRL